MSVCVHVYFLACVCACMSVCTCLFVFDCERVEVKMYSLVLLKELCAKLL